MELQIANIPDSLKAMNQWLGHDRDKKPISALNGQSTEWQNNLASFDVAEAYAKQHGLGIGFAFNGQTEFFGIDLDGCVNPTTAAIESWAMAIVNLFSSYCEVSRSKTGLKIICRGSFSTNLNAVDFGEVKHGVHRQQAEFKTNSGYFALTGLQHPRLARYEISHADPEEVHERIVRYKRVLAYLGAVPPAIEGQRGDSATFTVACSLSHGFDLTPDEALILSQPWNQTCVPPWSEKDLQHKFDEANKREDSNGRKRGYRLEELPILQTIIDFTNRFSPNKPQQAATESESDFIPFPSHLLPYPLCQFVNEVSRAIGCDASFVALPLLSTIAAAIADSCKLQAKKEWIVPAIIWTAFIGESGTAKSPALRAVMKYPKIRQQKHRELYDLKRRQWEHQFDVYESELKRWKSKDLVNGGVEKPQPPVEPTYQRTVVSDATMESLISILADNPAGVLASYDELAALFGGFDKYRQGNDSDSPIWLSIYNGESISVDRKGNGHTFVPSAYVSITGGIQPGLLPSCFTSKHQDSGLLARFLMAWPPRNIKQWTEEEISDMIDAQMSNVFDYCYELQPHVDQQNNRTPYILQLNNEAKQVWIEFNNQHNKELIETSGSLAAAFSKQEESPLRFAIVFHCVKLATGIATDQFVDASTITAAIALTQWFKNETKRIYETLSFDRQQSNIADLVSWIKSRGGSITVRDLQNLRKSQYPKSANAEAALNDLVSAKLGVWVANCPTPKGGRPSKSFRLTT